MLGNDRANITSALNGLSTQSTMTVTGSKPDTTQAESAELQSIKEEKEEAGSGLDI